MRATSSMARAAASRARAASSPWSCSSFSAAMARKVNPWRATEAILERVAYAQHAVPRAQRRVDGAAVAAQVQALRVVDVAHRRLEGEAALDAVDAAHARREPAECGEARIARMLL